MVAYNIGNEEPAIILKDKNKFENLKPTIWFEVEDVAIFYKEMLNNDIKFLSEPLKLELVMQSSLKIHLEIDLALQIILSKE
ncbi:hypothetical protein SD457_05610 [Coprobacillaceae bacterium CR2/5/TPMF4]|nr:hypothetical protein SD457_05610 [Coprobacillaceae bacterium CR2/5/TPMF4]